MKEKLATHCGTNASAMRLQLFHESAPRTTSRSEERCASGKKSTKRDDRSFKRRRKARVLLSVRRDAITVIDTDPMSVSANRWLEDLSKVEKYVMSDEAYEKREGTYRQWARKKRRRRPDVDVKQKNNKKLRNQRKHERRKSTSKTPAAAAREKTLTTYSSFECVRHVVQGPDEVNPEGKRGAGIGRGKVANTAQQTEDVKEEEQKDVINMPPSLPKGQAPGWREV